MSLVRLLHLRPQSLSSLSSTPVFTSIRSFATAEADPRLSEPRAVDECDLLIVGGGPSGLAAAIKFKQLAAQAGKDLRVCLVEKGGEIGKWFFPFFQVIFK